jgi:hypothetical protein
VFLVGASLADCPPGGRRLSTRHKLLSDRLWVVYGPFVFQGAVLVLQGSFQTIRRVLVDRPPAPSGPSARTSRTIRPRLRRVAKYFACSVSFSLWDCLGFIPRVGRSVVTTQPWKTRVGILGCEFGT